MISSPQPVTHGTPLYDLRQVKENAEHKLLHCPDLDELTHRIGYQDTIENILTPSNKLDLVKFSKLVTKKIIRIKHP